MRLISTLSLLAALAVAVPAFALPALADDATTAAPAAQAAPATQPDAGSAPPADAAPAAAPKPRAPNPEGVSDAADQSLWCGQAFVQSADEVKKSGDQQGADAMLKDGNDLLAKGADMLSKSGFDASKMDATKTAYGTQVQTDLAGDPADARYSYEECLVLTPEGAATTGGDGSAPAAAAPAN